MAFCWWLTWNVGEFYPSMELIGENIYMELSKCPFVNEKKLEFKNVAAHNYIKEK